MHQLDVLIRAALGVVGVVAIGAGVAALGAGAVGAALARQRTSWARLSRVAAIGAGVQISRGTDVAGRDHARLLAALLEQPGMAMDWHSAIALRLSGPRLRALLVEASMEVADRDAARALKTATVAAADEAWAVRLAVAENAWKIGPSAEPLLRRLMDDPEADVREAAADSLEDGFE